MGRLILRLAQLGVTLMFLTTLKLNDGGHWLGWFVPMLLIVLVMINSIWFTRFVSWVIFAVAFFAFMSVLGAFTLGWRSVEGFNPAPYYRTIIMYVLFVYVSLGQIKLIGGGTPPVPVIKEIS